MKLICLCVVALCDIVLLQQLNGELFVSFLKNDAVQNDFVYCLIYTLKAPQGMIGISKK